jgi:hypothetical protein
MVMIVTKEQIKALNPCTDAWRWYLSEKQDEKTPDLSALLLVTNKENASWARWLFTRLMTVSQRREIAIYAAEQVLPLFTAEYPNDDRPQKAINAAKAVLLNDTPENRAAAYAPAYAAYAAADAAAAYDAYAAAYTAAYAAAYAAAGADADADAGAAADVDADADAVGKRKEMQEQIIREAVRIMERDLGEK